MSSPAPKRSVSPAVALLGCVGIVTAALITLANSGDQAPERPAFHDERPLVTTPAVQEATGLPMLRVAQPLAAEPATAVPPVETTAEGSRVAAPLYPLPSLADLPAPPVQPIGEQARVTAVPDVAAPAKNVPLISEPPEATAQAPVAGSPAPEPAPIPVAAESKPFLPVAEPASPAALPSPAPDATASQPSAVTKSEAVEVTPARPPPAPAMTAAGPVEPPARPAPVIANAMLQSAERHLSNGDIAGARLFLERGLRQGDGQSALRLGATYDPIWLAERGVQGVAADPDKARAFYVKARDLGIAAAATSMRRLEAARR